MSDHLRVIIGIPSGTLWQAQFGVDLCSMVARFSNERVPGFKSQELRIANVRSSILCKNRLDICKFAKEVKADYVLMIDTDHTFPSNLLHRLIKHGKEIVAANCVTKQIPAATTARAFDGSANGVPVFTDPQSVGLEEVWRVGTGVMLLSRSALQKIPNSAWAMVYKEEHDTYQGEDWTFCEAANKAGVKIWIDHDLSKEVGHVGNFEYTHDYVGAIQQVPA